MSDPLFSPYWYRAAALHPRLVAGLVITQQDVRDQRWYLLSHPLTGRQLRVNALGYELVGRLDGRLSLQQIWDALVWRLGDDTPTQHEVLAIVSSLGEAGMLHSEATPDLGAIFDAARRKRRGSFSLLALKVPLLDPTALLDRLAPLGRVLVSGRVLLLWAVLVLWALVTAGMQWRPLSAYASQHLLQPSNLMWAWLLYPLIKAVHELAHGMAVRRWGGEVREMGVSLFLLMPVPYVDASAASAFPSRRQRMAVSATGIVVETALAAVALAVWLMAADGHLREAAFALMTIAGLSTVLVNANPLMRYDGYYFLSDALALPGLAGRASRWLRYLGERWLLGSRQAVAPPADGRERAWLTLYGVAAPLYRAVFFIGLIGWIGSTYLLPAAALALWMAGRHVLLPLCRLMAHVWQSPALQPVRGRAVAVAGGGLLAVLIGLFIAPVPQVTRTEGIVWLPEDAQVRNDTEGVVEQLLAQPGQAVTAGQPLLQLSNPELQTRRDALLARLSGREHSYTALLLEQPSAAMVLAEELASLREEIGRLDTQLDGLLVRAPSAGVLAVPDALDLPGRHAARGQSLGVVLGDRPLTVRALIRQDDIGLLQTPPSAIEVRVADRRHQTLPARLLSQTPAPVAQLPSAALGDRAGGAFAVDVADPDGLKTLHTHYVVDLEVPGVPLRTAGARVWIHLRHGAAPLATQWLRQARQTFVGRFGAGDRSWLGATPL